VKITFLISKATEFPLGSSKGGWIFINDIDATFKGKGAYQEGELK
jgi:hypothetical protein